MTTKKRNSRILDEMHETARGLHGVRLISKRRMGDFEALCNIVNSRERQDRHQANCHSSVRASACWSTVCTAASCKSGG